MKNDGPNDCQLVLEMLLFLMALNQCLFQPLLEGFVCQWGYAFRVPVVYNFVLAFISCLCRDSRSA